MTETPVTPIASPSIVESIKEALGLAKDYNPFDPELIMHINSVLGDLHQLGVGPEPGFEVTGPDETWNHFLGGDKRLNMVKSYVYLSVRMLWDPPSVGYVLTSIEKKLEKMEWRITTAQDDITYPLPPDSTEIPEDPFGEVEIVIDGGSS